MIVCPVLCITKHNDKYLKENSEISYLIGKYKKAHIIEETFVPLAAVKMAEMMHGKHHQVGWQSLLLCQQITVVRCTEELKSCWRVEETDIKTNRAV